MSEKMTLEDMASVLHARKYAYDILRRFFIEEPVQEYLKIFVQQKMAEHFPFVNDSEGISEGVRNIKEYLANFDPVYNRDDFEALHWDYTRMFIGPFELPAPPWESVYVRKDRLLFQKHTLEVRNIYKKYGFAVKEQNFEADDHIGLELDFMYHLNDICLRQVENNGDLDWSNVKHLLGEQKSFLEKHLLMFVPEFADNVIEHADTDFYRGLAKILKNYLHMDAEMLNELLKIEPFA